MIAETTDRKLATTKAKASAGLTSDSMAGSFALTADTMPGALGPMGAPPGCDTPDEYLAAMRWRYANSPAAKQQMWLLAHRQDNPNSEPVPVVGPFAPEAKQILNAIRFNKTPNAARTPR